MSDSVSTVVVVHCQALQLGKLGAVDFDRRKSDALAVALGIETMASEFDDFGFRAAEQQVLGDVRPHERVDCRSVAGQRLANGHCGSRVMRGHCFTQLIVSLVTIL